MSEAEYIAEMNRKAKEWAELAEWYRIFHLKMQAWPVFGALWITAIAYQTGYAWFMVILISPLTFMWIIHQV